MKDSFKKVNEKYFMTYFNVYEDYKFEYGLRSNTYLNRYYARYKESWETLREAFRCMDTNWRIYKGIIDYANDHEATVEFLKIHREWLDYKHEFMQKLNGREPTQEELDELDRAFKEKVIDRLNELLRKLKKKGYKLGIPILDPQTRREHAKRICGKRYMPDEFFPTLLKSSNFFTMFTLRSISSYLICSVYKVMLNFTYVYFNWMHNTIPQNINRFRQYIQEKWYKLTNLSLQRPLYLNVRRGVISLALAVLAYFFILNALESSFLQWITDYAKAITTNLHAAFGGAFNSTFHVSCEEIPIDTSTTSNPSDGSGYTSSKKNYRPMTDKENADCYPTRVATAIGLFLIWVRIGWGLLLETDPYLGNLIVWLLGDIFGDLFLIGKWLILILLILFSRWIRLNYGYILRYWFLRVFAAARTLGRLLVELIKGAIDFLADLGAFLIGLGLAIALAYIDIALGRAVLEWAISKGGKALSRAKKFAEAVGEELQKLLDKGIEVIFGQKRIYKPEVEVAQCLSPTADFFFKVGFSVLFTLAIFTWKEYAYLFLEKPDYTGELFKLYESNVSVTTSSFFLPLINFDLDSSTVVFLAENSLLIDQFSLFFFKFTAALGAAYMLLFTIIARRYRLDMKDNALMFFFSVFSSMVLCISNNLILTIILIECVSFASYTLCTVYKNNSGAEAAWKYFALGSIGSIFYLFGASFIFLSTYSVNYTDISLALHSTLQDATQGNLLVSVGLLFIFCGLFVKLALAPFHQWSIDVYDSVPYFIMFYLSTIPKIGIFVHVVRLAYYVFCDLNYNINLLFLMVGLFSIIVGSLGGFLQSKVKKLFAYSSVSHVGYIFLALSSGTLLGLEASIFYTVVYILTSMVIFFLLAASSFRARNIVQLSYTYITDFKKFARVDSIGGVLFALLLFSLAGIPPFPGFFAKFSAIVALLYKANYFISIIVVYCSVVSCFYYIRIVKIMFADLTLWNTGLLSSSFMLRWYRESLNLSALRAKIFTFMPMGNGTKSLITLDFFVGKFFFFFTGLIVSLFTLCITYLPGIINYTQFLAFYTT